jgi:hypothetical protein
MMSFCVDTDWCGSKLKLPKAGGWQIELGEGASIDYCLSYSWAGHANLRLPYTAEIQRTEGQPRVR